MRPPTLAGLALIVALVLGACAGSPGAEKAQPDAAPTTAITGSLLAKAALAPCPASTAKAGDLPELTLPCLGGGEPVRLAHLGKPTVLNLWASWCRPCATELPVFAAVERELGSRVLFVGVDTADTIDGALQTLIDAGVRFASLADRQRKVQRQLGLAGLPATVFVRADGSIAHTKLGPIADAAELRAALLRHLGVAA